MQATKMTPRSTSAVKATLIATAITSLMTLSMGCSQSGQFPLSSLGDSNQSAGISQPSDGSDGGSGVPAGPTDPSDDSNGYKMVPLSWESTKNPERAKWSAYLQKIILNQWSSLLPGSTDITNFCPTYNNLNNNERANVWAQIFSAITKYESAYSPVSRMQETTMGTDPVTNQPVYSEGLLQLSYQDIQWAPWCQFDWSKDKSLSATNPNKTILSPYLNLDCGVGIMAKQIKSKGAIVVSSGVYWAVIKSGGKYQQISGIQAIVKSLPLCK